jgi:hypothetical protein
MYDRSDVPPSAALTGRHSTISLHIPPFYQTSLREVNQRTKETNNRSLPSHGKPLKSTRQTTKKNNESQTLESRTISGPFHPRSTRWSIHHLSARRPLPHTGRFINYRHRVRFAVRSPPGSTCGVSVAALDGGARDRINVPFFLANRCLRGVNCSDL